MHWLLGGYMWLFIHRPFEYYPKLGDLQIERIYMILMIVCWAVWPSKVFIKNRLHTAIAFFTMALAVCWLASPWRDLGADTIENYVKVAVFYVLVVTTVRDEVGLRRIVKFYLFAISLYLAHSLLEYTNGRYEWRQGIRRMLGVDVTYGDPNAFASTLLLALPLVLSFWVRARTWRSGMAPLALMGFAGLAILLTGSRTGFVGLCGFAVVCALLSRYRLRLLPVIGLTAVLVALALPGELQNRFLTIVDSSYGPKNALESAEGRIGGFMEGARLWGEYPLLGVGPGAFAVASGVGFNPHNVYGQVISEVGTLGTLAWLGLLACFFLNGLETRRLLRQRPAARQEFAAQVAQAVTWTVVMLLFMGCAGHNLYRYNWLWLAAFQVCALHGLRLRAVPFSGLRSGSGRAPLPYLIGPRPTPRVAPQRKPRLSSPPTQHG
jgi:O-antigen ligase